MSNIALLDVAVRLHRAGVPLIPRLLSRAVRVLYSCEIPLTARIDRSVVFAHKGLGVVVGHDTVIGAGTKILHHVTIGGRGGIRANPRIGRNVLVGAGAIVLGDIEIGDGATIAAQAVVIRDVPPGSVVAGVPASIRQAPSGQGWEAEDQI